MEFTITVEVAFLYHAFKDSCSLDCGIGMSFLGAEQSSAQFKKKQTKELKKTKRKGGKIPVLQKLNVLLQNINRFAAKDYFSEEILRRVSCCYCY